MVHSISQRDHVNVVRHQKRTQEQKDFGSEIFNFIIHEDTALRKRRNFTVLAMSLLLLRTKRMVKKENDYYTHTRAQKLTIQTS